MWDKHQQAINEVLSKATDKGYLKRFLKIHKEKIKYLQHERLVHLIVTLTVALTTPISFVATLFSENIYFLVPDAMLILLLVAYLIYYRKLETLVQRWYDVNDKIREKILDSI